MKFKTQVKLHYRKSKSGKKYKVRNYSQTRYKPRVKSRGKLRNQPQTKKFDTFWLMDSRGRFRGRADRTGKTRAKFYKIKRQDKTGIKRGNKGIIFGRYKQ